MLINEPHQSQPIMINVKNQKQKQIQWSFIIDDIFSDIIIMKKNDYKMKRKKFKIRNKKIHFIENNNQLHNHNVSDGKRNWKKQKFFPTFSITSSHVSIEAK